MVWFGLCQFLDTAHVIFVQISTSTWGQYITSPIWINRKLWITVQVEWQPDLSSQQNIFNFDYGTCKLTSFDVESLTSTVSSCILAGIFCVVTWWLKYLLYRFWRWTSINGSQSKGSSNLKYEGVSISYQHDLFLTDRFSQDFHSLFGHHIKTLWQSLSIMCWLVYNFSWLQAWSVSQIIFFQQIML